MYCSQCGSEVNDGARFCPSCGNNIGGAAPQQAAPQQTPPPMQTPQPPQGQQAYQQPYQQPYQQQPYGQQMYAPVDEGPWYGKTWVIILFLVLFWPVGIVFMWMKTCVWPTYVKIIISVAFALWLIFVIGSTVAACSTVSYYYF